MVLISFQNTHIYEFAIFQLLSVSVVGILQLTARVFAFRFQNSNMATAHSGTKNA